VAATVLAALAALCVGLASAGVLWFGERITATAVTILAATGCVVDTIVGIALAQPTGPARAQDEVNAPGRSEDSATELACALRPAATGLEQRAERR
jgi:di/tricarboxylate transporter